MALGATRPLVLQAICSAHGGVARFDLPPTALVLLRGDLKGQWLSARELEPGVCQFGVRCGSTVTL